MVKRQLKEVTRVTVTGEGLPGTMIFAMRSDGAVFSRSTTGEDYWGFATKFPPADATRDCLLNYLERGGYSFQTGEETDPPLCPL
jgi:hypothetical protein